MDTELAPEEQAVMAVTYTFDEFVQELTSGRWIKNAGKMSKVVPVEGRRVDEVRHCCIAVMCELADVEYDPNEGYPCEPEVVRTLVEAFPWLDNAPPLSGNSGHLSPHAGPFSAASRLFQPLAAANDAVEGWPLDALKKREAGEI